MSNLSRNRTSSPASIESKMCSADFIRCWRKGGRRSSIWSMASSETRSTRPTIASPPAPGSRSTRSVSQPVIQAAFIQSLTLSVSLSFSEVSVSPLVKSVRGTRSVRCQSVKQAAFNYSCIWFFCLSVCLSVCLPVRSERLVIYCQTTGVSAARVTHCATYFTICRPLIRAFSGWIRTSPPTSDVIVSQTVSQVSRRSVSQYVRK